MTTLHARGSFEVKITPQPQEPDVGDPGIARMALYKVFSGEMTGTARGQMLAFEGRVKGSAGYVAMDRVEAELGGRRGGFTLQHTGTLDRGAPQLSITVVPDTGTGELEGITGTLDIDIRDGQHFYDFAYRLPATP